MTNCEPAKYTKKKCFCFSLLQDAIKHNSFFEPKRKLERGDVDKAFETVDHILEGTLQHIFDKKLSVFGLPCLFLKCHFGLFFSDVTWP